MAYVRINEDASLSGLGCGPGCKCGPCRRSQFSGFGERYIRDDDFFRSLAPPEPPPPPEPPEPQGPPLTPGAFPPGYAPMPFPGGPPPSEGMSGWGFAGLGRGPRRRRRGTRPANVAVSQTTSPVVVTPGTVNVAVPPPPPPAPSPAAPASAPAPGDQAVAQNQRWATRLGWSVIYGPMATWILGFRGMTPSPSAFAQAVGDWQRRNGLPRDGILGPNTWRAMLADVKKGTPRPFRTAEGVVRPHGRNQVVAVFGDPTQPGWEAANLVPITAPGGQQFAPRVTSLSVHRLIAPQFTRLFAAILNAGLWKEIFPSAGTYDCRMKHPNQAIKCNSPGVDLGRLSTHSWGITIDIRARDYPFYTAEMRQSGAPLRNPPSTLLELFQNHGFHFGLWFMNGRPDQSGKINFTGADPMHFQFATGY